MDFDLWGEDLNFPPTGIVDIHVDDEDRLWLATTTKGVAIVEPNRSKFKLIDIANTPVLGSNMIAGLAKGKDGKVWACAYGGGVHLMSASGVEKSFRKDKTFPSIISDECGSIASDPDMNPWVATVRDVVHLVEGASSRSLVQEALRLMASFNCKMGICGLTAQVEELDLGNPPQESGG